MGGRREQLPAGPAGDSPGVRGLGGTVPDNRAPWGVGGQAEAGTAAPIKGVRAASSHPKHSCLPPAPGLESCIHTVLA